MPKPCQEQWCLGRLKSAILDQHPDAALRHEPGRQPPDFWLDVNDRRFAVEVSTIRVEEDQTHWESLRRFMKKIEGRAIAARELSGRYVVEACVKLPAARNAREARKLKKTLEVDIRGYLRETKTAASSPPHDLRVDDTLFGRIRKYAPEGAKVHLVGGLTNKGASEAEIGPELQALLDERISKKRARLADCKHPTILVLYDCYWLEDETPCFVERIKQSPDTSFFRAVFLINGIGDGVFAHQSGPLVG